MKFYTEYSFQFPEMNIQYKNLIGRKKDIYYIAVGINFASNEEKYM